MLKAFILFGSGRLCLVINKGLQYSFKDTRVTLPATWKFVKIPVPWRSSKGRQSSCALHRRGGDDRPLALIMISPDLIGLIPIRASASSFAQPRLSRRNPRSLLDEGKTNPIQDTRHRKVLDL